MCFPRSSLTYERISRPKYEISRKIFKIETSTLVLTVSKAACICATYHVLDLRLHDRAEGILLSSLCPKDFIKAIYDLVVLSRLWVSDFDLIHVVRM